MNLEKFREKLIRKERVYRAFIGFSMAFLGFVRFLLKDNLVFNDLSSGFLTGLILGMNLICLYLIFKTNKALKDERLLKAMYIRAYDERENFIKVKSVSYIISILALGIFIVSIFASYINIIVFYTLAFTGVFLLLVGLVLKIYWRKMV